jgi:hypothetical protein
MMTAPFQALMVSSRSAEGAYGLMVDARMAMPSQYDTDRTDEPILDCASGQEPSFAAQLRKTLNTIPAYTWYAVPSGKRNEQVRTKSGCGSCGPSLLNSIQ